MSYKMEGLEAPALKTELVFLFIQEEHKIRSTSRILKLINALESVQTLHLQGRYPHEENKETEEGLLSDPQFSPSYMIINMEHPQIADIVKLAKEKHKGMPIILLYSSFWVKNLKEYEDKYDIKYELEKGSVSKTTITNLFLKIRSDRDFRKKENTNDRYEYKCTLGKGTSSIVDLYYDRKERRDVAVKKIQVEGMRAERKSGASNEVQNMKEMNIPTSIKFYHYNIENENRFIYMEYANLGALDNLIGECKKEGREIAQGEIFDFLCDIMLALFALNRKGMMHRDIKSENILLAEEEVNGAKRKIAKLSDLGISRQIDGVVGSMTACGTPYYVSPEVAAGQERYDYNADIWSLGVVLYELITLEKPWCNPLISTQELFKLIFSTPYPPLPAGTDKHLKYLVKIMLKKDPSRRATLEDILCLDFMYARIVRKIREFHWEDVADFKAIADLRPKVKPCYKFMSILDDADLNLISDASKMYVYTPFVTYKASYFSSPVSKAKKGSDLEKLFNDVKQWKDAKLHNSNKTPEAFIKELLVRGIIIPISHSIKDASDEEELTAFTKHAMENGDAYYYNFPCCGFEASQKGYDNFEICNIKPQEQVDYLLLSEFILKKGKSLSKQNKTIYEIDEFMGDNKRILFQYGISLFQDCDPFSIPLTETDHSRVAFFLNLYQIMFLHHQFNLFQNNHKSKKGLWEFYKNDVAINYKFKNFSLSNLEVKHVIFRGNKPIPGNYMRLVYGSDAKCRLLPDYGNLQPLLLLDDFNNEQHDFVIFNKKEVDEQLDDVTFKFIGSGISGKEDEIIIINYIKPLLTDFGAKDTPEFPEGFLQFIVSYLKKHRSFTEKDSEGEGKTPYKVRISENDMKALKFLNQKFIRHVESGGTKITYVE